MNHVYFSLSYILNQSQQLTNKPKETMGIEQFVLERERRIGEAKGVEKGVKITIEKSILNSFDIGLPLEQIRLITGESKEYIMDVLKKNKRV